MRMPGAILGTHKQRLARLTALAGLLVVATLVWHSAPQAVQVELDLGPAHREYIELRVAYVQGGEELHGVAFSFPEGAPDHVRHSVELPAGEFEVHTEVRPLHGAWLASVEPLRTPSKGLVRIHVPVSEADAARRPPVSEADAARRPPVSEADAARRPPGRRP